jgi:hypothetical protein
VIAEVAPGTRDRVRGGRSRSIAAFDQEGPARSSAFKRFGAALGWGAMSLLTAYAALTGLLPGSFALSPRAPHPVAGLVAEGVEGHWIENAAAGRLYVVSGHLRTETSEANEVGTQLRVRLLDAGGTALAVESAAVGPPIYAEWLREWNVRDLLGRHEERALRMAWRPLAPGESRPFQAVFNDLPAGAAAFEFQAVTAAAPSPREP